MVKEIDIDLRGLSGLYYSERVSQLHRPCRVTRSGRESNNVILRLLRNARLFCLWRNWLHGLGICDGKGAFLKGAIGGRNARSDRKSTRLLYCGVERPNANLIRQNSALISVNVEHIEVQPVACVLPLIRTAGVQAGVEQSIVELAVIRDASHNGFTVGPFEIEYTNIFSMRVDHPGEAVVSATIALLIFVLSDQHTVVRSERIVANALDHFDGIRIEHGLARRKRIRLRIIIGSLVLWRRPVEPHHDSRMRSLCGLDRARGEVDDGQS